MRTSEFIKRWDGFSPLWLNIHTKSGITDSERMTKKSDYDNYFDDYEVMYITTDGSGEMTIEVYEK